MTRTLVSAAVLLVAGTAVQPVFAQAQVPDTVLVAPPTGETEADRASILAALDGVEPGGTVRLAPGTYLIGEIIRVETPRITFLGHPDGTVLRGCELAAYEEMRRDVSRARDWSGRWAAYSRCGILELTGGRATVRNLIFEYTDRGLGLGCCLAEPAFRPSDGGYLIENNTFRNSRNAIRASLASADTTVIRRNHFINVYHAVSAAVSHFHVTDNDISVPEPEHVPGIGHPGFAIGIEPVPPGPGGTVTSTINVCEHNVIAGNRIEGHPDGIVLFARPGTTCRRNVIRDNSIAVRRVRLPVSQPYVGPARITSEADSTVVGVPLALFYDPVSWVGDDSAPQGIFEGNLIEGNHITGAEGLGIVVLRASRNRIVNNTIMGVTVRDPYPGNTIGRSRPEEWVEANGSGIWLSPGSDGNEIVGNTFEEVETAAVFLEGDSNRVALRSATDSVRDLGTGNEVTRPGGDGDGGRSLEKQTSDTVRVAPPTGDAQEDRAAILETLEAAGPGDTLRFGPGRYVTGGARITVTTPGVTLVGDADGTVIRGCDQETLDTLDIAAFAQGRCAGLFWLQGGRQAVRSMTLEGVHTALDLGWFAGEGDAPGEDGGYSVEDVTFRRVSKGVNVMGQWAEVATIRDNTFLNVYHAITLQGGTSHVLDNDISAPEPGTVFYQGFPGGAISALAAPECGENVIAGNRIEGHPDGIIVGTLVPGTSCRNNIIRNNVVVVGRVTFGPDAPGRSLINVEHEDDRTVTGVPITILNAEGEEGVPAGAPPEWQGPAFSGNHVIEGNRVLGALGLGIQIHRSSGNRVANNSIEAVVRREPFPGNHLHLHPGPWEAANGSGIWISPGSEDNEIVGNTFEDVAAAEVFLEGDSNRVTLRSATDSVLDRATGNEVSVADGAEGSDVIPEERVAGAADTVHVAPPTGAKEADRTSILAALAQVQPSDAMQFAPGTYIVGEIIPIETGHLTILGNANGTTLRGCDPDAYERMERETEAAGDDQEARMAARLACGVFEMTGGHATIRGLAFEYTWVGLALGAGHSSERRVTDGGYLVEDNVFRNSANGVRPGYLSGAPTVIRGNRFMNMGHAVSGTGAGIHVLDNDMSVPDPQRLLSPQGPLFAIGIGPAQECVVEGNRIEGHPSGIGMFGAPGRATRGNVIRDNTITVRGAGLPLGLWGGQEDGDGIEIEDNLIERNRIMGAVGAGIALNRASRIRILDNTITGITLGDPSSFGEANGAGLWASPGSNENEIVGNNFEDIATHDIVLEGDRNAVQTHGGSEAVRDLGTGNRVDDRPTPELPEPGTSASAEHEIHVQSGDLTRIINTAMRATGALPEDAPPVLAPTAAKAIEALDHAGITYGLALSGGYFWGSPALRSRRMVPILDSLGLGIGDARDRVRAENLYLAEQVARYPDRLVGACSVNPLAQYALEELELCAADSRITAFSLNLAPAPVDFRDETHVARLRTLFEALAMTDLAVIVHMRNRGEGYGAGDAGVFIREVLAAAPGVPVQIAHMAGWGPYDEATDSAMQAFVDAFEDGTLDRDRFTFGVGVLLDDPEGLEDDTAAARRAAEQNTRLAERMRQVGIERVVFSTDWPFFPPHGDARTRIERNRARLRNVLPLEPEELDRFFSNVGPVFRHLVESHSTEQGSRE